MYGFFLNYFTMFLKTYVSMLIGVKLEMHHKESVQIKTVYWLIFKK